MSGNAPASPPRRPITGRTVFFACLAFFGLVAAMNVVLVWTALASFPGVEVDSSYKAGQQFPAEQVAAHAQAERHWQVGATAGRTADDAVEVIVAVRDKDGHPVAGLGGEATLRRPSNAGLDRHVALTETEPGRYAGTTPEAAAGVYDLVIALDDAGGVKFRSINRIVVAAPAATPAAAP